MLRFFQADTHQKKLKTLIFNKILKVNFSVSFIRFFVEHHFLAAYENVTNRKHLM